MGTVRKLLVGVAVMFPAAMAITPSVATPAFAATIVQNLTAHQPIGGGDIVPYEIIGTPFNPALGTLDAVTATLTGSYTPLVDLSGGPGSPPSPEIISTSYFVNAGAADSPNYFSGSLGSQMLQKPGGSGMPTSFDRSFNFGDVSAFI